MKKRFSNILTKLSIFIVCLFFSPDDVVAQDQGAKTVKTGRTSKRRKRIKQGKRSRKRSYRNQDKATRKRMKRAARNAKRRQRGKPMRNNRLT